jgi:hypothetical protein
MCSLSICFVPDHDKLAILDGISGRPMLSDNYSGSIFQYGPSGRTNTTIG